MTECVTYSKGSCCTGPRSITVLAGDFSLYGCAGAKSRWHPDSPRYLSQEVRVCPP